jgi:ribonuclease P protein component
MKSPQRLRNRREFAGVYRLGRLYRGEQLSLRVLTSGGSQSRFGFAVGKALGGAVVRNRVKRQLRAAVDSLPVIEGSDVIVSAQRDSYRFASLQSQLRVLLGRADLLESRA